MKGLIFFVMVLMMTGVCLVQEAAGNAAYRSGDYDRYFANNDGYNGNGGHGCIGYGCDK